MLFLPFWFEAEGGPLGWTRKEQGRPIGDPALTAQILCPCPWERCELAACRAVRNTRAVCRLSSA